MKLPIFQVDAFASRLFGGNPAAVVPLQRWLPDEVLLDIAAENNLAETAFVIPQEEESPLRWFTPKVEVDLCGHATLATAHVLFHEYFRHLKEIKFGTKSGTLKVSREDGLLTLDFPARPASPIPVTEELCRALRAQPREAWQSKSILAIFDSEAEVAALMPDMVDIVQLDTYAVIASAPGSQVDFVSRFFAPRAGIPEDPVTGSAHCTLTPYWAQRLGKNSLHARQISERGGELYCRLSGDRVLIAGYAVDYLKGLISVPH